MLIAKVLDGQVVQVENYLVMYPLLTFPTSGPTPSQMEELGCMHVNLFKDHDQETETLEQCAPYIEGGWVYLVNVRPRTAEELQARVDSKKTMNQNRASIMLKDSDYLVGGDVQALITNHDAILTYRSALRAIALNPPEVVDTWPIKPKTEWIV